MSQLSSQIERARKVVQDLRAAKSQMQGKVDKLKVNIVVDESQIVLRSIEKVFGVIPKDDPRHNVITFEMYLHCQRIISAAGQAKAGSEIDKGFS